MDYNIIAEQLLKRGFLPDGVGSIEKTIGNININFVEHPFYHVIMYYKKSKDGRTVFVPSDIKLPKKCDINDVIFVIESLIRDVDENKIVMDIFKKLNPDKKIDTKEVTCKQQTDKHSYKIEYKIKQTIAILSESSKGWKKELNLMSWNGKEAKFDIREWDSEHKKMGKGITFTVDELKKLRDVLNDIELF